MKKLFASLALILFTTILLPSCADNDLDEMEMTEQPSPTDPPGCQPNC